MVAYSIVLPVNTTEEFNRGVAIAAPAAPTGFSALASSGQVSLSWNAVGDILRYHIYYSTSSGVTTADTRIQVASTETSYILTGLTNGVTYYFKIAAVGPGGVSVLSSEINSTPSTFINNYSLDFDGVDEYVDFGDNYDFSPATAFSFSLWVRPQNISAQRCMISKTTDDANVWGVGIYHNNTGRILVQMRSSTVLRAHTFTDSLASLTWQHVVVTYDGSQDMSGLNVYIDGNVDSGGSATSGSLGGSLETTTPLYIGRRNSAFHYSGNMNQISRWDKALSASEILEIYNNGIPTNLSELSFAADCQSWWHFSDPGNFPTEEDQIGTIDGTLTNMEVGDYETQVP